MKKILLYLLFLILLLPACKAKHSFNSREGKKKLKYYNSVPYQGYPTNPKKNR